MLRRGRAIDCHGYNLIPSRWKRPTPPRRVSGYAKRERRGKVRSERRLRTTKRRTEDDRSFRTLCVAYNGKVCLWPFELDAKHYSPSSFSPLFLSLSLSLQSPLSALWCPIHPAPEPRVFVLLVFYGVARLTQDKIGLWYDHETHLFLYIVCTLWLLSFPLRCAAATCITYVRLDPSTCWTLFKPSINA